MNKKSYVFLKKVLIAVMICSIAATGFIIKLCLDLPTQEATISTAESTNIQYSDVNTTIMLSEPTETTHETTSAPEPIILSASIGATGDLLMHKPVFDNTTYNASVQQSDGSYDFTSVFQYLAEYTSSLDYTVANLETTLAGTDNGYAYSGYPLFNCPDEVVDGVKNAGFDLLLTANNHSYDTNLVGFKRTIQVVREKGLENLGTYLSADETKWKVVDIGSIKIGMLCYTYASRVTEDGRPSLNDNAPISEVGLCNYFYSGSLPAFYDEVKGYLAEMKEAGAEASIMFIHWGQEYMLNPNAEQKAIAQKLCDLGIDVIIGGHPHVIQPIDLLESTVDSGHKTVCLYSMGNAVSNQRLGSISTISTAHTEDGILFSVRFEKDSDNSLHLAEVNVLPTWVYKHDNSEGKTEYPILLLDMDTKDTWQEKYNLSDSAFQAAQNSYYRTMAIVGEGLERVQEYLQRSSNFGY